jgi:hypothetical protein
MQNGVFENDGSGTPLPQTATTREQSIGEGGGRAATLNWRPAFAIEELPHG